MGYSRKSKGCRSRLRRKSRGGSMAGRLAVPAGLLVLQKMMHSRKRHHKSGKKSRTVRRRRVSRRR